MVKEHSQVLVILTGLIDLMLTVGAWLLSYWIRFHSGWLAYRGVAPPVTDLCALMVITALLTVLVFTRAGLYTPRRMLTLMRESVDIFKASLVVWAASVFVGHFLYNPRISLFMQGLFLAIWLTTLLTYRLSLRSVLRAIRRRGMNLRSVAIVGAGRLGQKVYHAICRQRWSGYRVLYFVDDRRIGEDFLGVRVHGPLDKVGAVLAVRPVDAVFIALRRDDQHRLGELVGKLETNVVDVNVVPDLLHYHFLRQDIRQIDDLSVVNLTHSPHSGWNAALKRAIDVIFSLIALLVLSPLMLLIAMVVKLTSSGPVMYRQRRASLGGEEFTILKFRSMVSDAEARNGAEWHMEAGDPRITPVGRALRKLSLDELPQLINVLKGDMSLVGPRPERPEFIARFSQQIPRYMLRHHVKAGLTGWAQVNGFRGRTSLRKRIQYDLDYISRWSVGFDLYVMLLTVFGGVISPRE